MAADPTPIPESDPLELATEQVIAACDGDTRAAVRALIVAKGLLEAELSDVYAASSKGYARGRIKTRRGPGASDDRGDLLRRTSLRDG